MGFHLVRYGTLGHIGRFSSADAVRYPRQTRVVVRSDRGLETGEILSNASLDGIHGAQVGQILRRMSVQDELLAARLESRRHEAYEACQQLLNERGVSAALVDVEHLFDGEGLYFYFLGTPAAEVGELLQALATQYETAVEFREFAETLAEGCGPGCGTEAAAGQGGCGSCTSCALVDACSVNRSSP
ncbi:MAG: PSP1 domain-containing protein [Planctomycetota bacterium]